MHAGIISLILVRECISLWYVPGKIAKQATKPCRPCQSIIASKKQNSM